MNDKLVNVEGLIPVDEAKGKFIKLVQNKGYFTTLIMYNDNTFSILLPKTSERVMSLENPVVKKLFIESIEDFDCYNELKDRISYP